MPTPMTLQEYAALTTEQQLDVVADMGTRLSKRLTEEHQVTLFRLHDFFVELYFHRQKTTITNIVVFKGVAIPDAYFDDVNLSPSWRLYVANEEPGKNLPNIT